MRSVALISVIAVSLAMTTAVPVLAQVDHKAEKELEAGYQKIVAMMKKKDVKGVMSMLTPDATMTEMGKTMTRAEFEPMLKQQFAGMQIESANIKFTKLSVKGNLAESEYTELMKAKVAGPNGKTANMGMKSRYKGTFKKMGGAWKLHRSETLGMPEMTMNGKPFNPAAPAK